MKKIFEIGIVIFIVVGMSYAKPVVSKYLRADTTYKMDTIVTLDTVIKTETYRDTSLFVKRDSVVHKGMRKGK